MPVSLSPQTALLISLESNPAYTMSPSVIVADEESYMVQSIEIILKMEGYRVISVEQYNAAAYLNEYCCQTPVWERNIHTLDVIGILRHVRSNFRKGDKVVILRAGYIGGAKGILRKAGIQQMA